MDDAKSSIEPEKVPDIVSSLTEQLDKTHIEKSSDTKKPRKQRTAQSDREKFDQARLLNTNLPEIRKKYKADLVSQKTKEWQKATAVSLVDMMSIRIGYEKRTKVKPNVDGKVDTYAAETPKSEQTLDFKADQTTDSKADQTLDSKADQTTDSKADQTLDYKADQTTDSKADQTLDSKADQTTDSKADQTLNADDDVSDAECEEDYMESADEDADSNEEETVGCCTLRAKHVQSSTDGDKITLDLKFRGKAKVLFERPIPNEKEVYMKLQKLKEGKKEGDRLFDANTNAPNVTNYLKNLLPGLTSKVFRTRTACALFEEKLREFSKEAEATTDPKSKKEKLLKAFRRANRCVAEELNHQHEIPATRKKFMATLNEQERKVFYLETSKEYYIDPRIVVAWCLKNKIQIAEVYSPALCEKFDYAIKEKNEDFIF